VNGAGRKEITEGKCLAGTLVRGVATMGNLHLRLDCSSSSSKKKKKKKKKKKVLM
jgi:hypothetical protein